LEIKNATNLNGVWHVRPQNSSHQIWPPNSPDLIPVAYKVAAAVKKGPWSQQSDWEVAWAAADCCWWSCQRMAQTYV